MSKNMQKIVLFIEPMHDAWYTPLKTRNLYMNRFAVEEDAAYEVLKNFELEKTSFNVSRYDEPECKNFTEERKQKGKDLINFSSEINCLVSSGMIQRNKITKSNLNGPYGMAHRKQILVNMGNILCAIFYGTLF